MHFFAMAFLLCLTSTEGFTNAGCRSAIVVPSSVPTSTHKWQHSSSHGATWPARHKPTVALRAATLPLESVAYSSSSSYLVRIVFLRAMAFVHLVAFLIAYKQNKALIGDNGITRARDILDAAEQRGQQKKQRRLDWRKLNHTDPSIPFFSIRQREQKLLRWIGRYVDKHPRLLHAREILWDRSDSLDRPLTTMLWSVKDRDRLNPWLDSIALTGLSVSVIIMLLGAANVPLVLAVCIQEDRSVN